MVCVTHRQQKRAIFRVVMACKVRRTYTTTKKHCAKVSPNRDDDDLNCFWHARHTFAVRRLALEHKYVLGRNGRNRKHAHGWLAVVSEPASWRAPCVRDVCVHAR